MLQKQKRIVFKEGLEGRYILKQITRLSKRVITQYLDLIPEHQLQSIDANLAKQEQVPCRVIQL